MNFVFRVIEEGEPNGHFGIVKGQDVEDLFWRIDEFTDPYQVELKELSQGGVCFFMQRENDGHGPTLMLADDNKLELSEDVERQCDSDKRWFKPKWPEYEKMRGVRFSVIKGSKK